MDSGFRNNYSLLGAWKGPAGNREVQARIRDFWKASGELGARYLVERMLRDEQLERLNAASGVLALIGTDSFLSIKEGLARSKGDEVNFGAEALVDALQLLEPSQDALDASGITPVLEKFSEYPDPDVREAVRELLGDGIRP